MKKNTIIFFVCLSIIYRTFTPLSFYFSGGKAFAMLMPVVVLYFLGNLYKSLSYNIAVIISLFPLLLGYLGVEYFQGYLPDSVSLFFAIGCIEYYLRTNDDIFAKYSLSAFYGSIVMLAIISLPILIAEPGINRTFNDMKAAGAEVLPLAGYFTISYGMVHAVPILVIPLFFFYKSIKYKLSKVLLVVAIVSLYVTTILSNASTPMFMLFMYVLFVIIYNPKQSNRSNALKIGGVFVVVIILFFSGLITSFLTSFQSLMGGTMQEGRIDEVVSYLETGKTTGDMSAREDRYDISLDAFLSHPLSPEYKINHIGKHSYLIDHLAAMGLIAFIPFALLLFYQYKKPLIHLGNEKGYFMMAYSAFIFLACYKNFFAAESAMFACPALLIYIRRHFLGMKHLKTR
jgi:hypothetical protein